MRFSTLLSVSGLLSAAAAHPGHDINEEILERRAFKSATRRSNLGHCADKLAARGIERRNMARRVATANKLKRRNVDTALSTDHNQTSKGYSLCTPESTIFASNNSCVLTPEVTNGPYYVSGEFVRQDITEGQGGVPITLDYQVIDVDTCEPVPDHYVEMWHCNATGVYSGIGGTQAGLDTTFLRGIQETDDDGVVQFNSIFPGHYTGRAPHIHLLVYKNGEELSNGTIGHDTAAIHVGQAFFDQDLISAVEATSPYTSNKQSLTTNDNDGILAEEADPDGVDPLMAYTLLGSTIEEGLFAWLAFGVNMTYSAAASPAASLYEDGGVANENGPGAGGPPGNGTGPPSGAGPSGSGAPPSGTAPSSAAPTA